MYRTGNMTTHLISVIREVHFVKDLGSFVLNGLHFYKVRRILSGSISVREEKKVLRESMQHSRYMFSMCC